jgi:hypothetical protein
MAYDNIQYFNSSTIQETKHMKFNLESKGNELLTSLLAPLSLQESHPTSERRRISLPR